MAKASSSHTGQAGTRMNFAKTAFGALAVVAALGASAVSPVFGADGDGATSTLTATLLAGSIGSRSVSLASPVVMTSALSSATVTGNFSVTVTESARSGTNPWSVTVDATSLSDGLGHTIPNSALAIDNRSNPLVVAGGGVSTGVAGSQNLTAARTLWSTSGQNTSILYTGTYSQTSTITLTPQNGTAAGVYTGTLTITLVQ